jgi:drug/metabolite transporter (DMT)-like permease
VVYTEVQLPNCPAEVQLSGCPVHAGIFVDVLATCRRRRTGDLPEGCSALKWGNCPAWNGDEGVVTVLSESTKDGIAWLNVCVFWGTTYLVIRIGVGHLPPMLFAGVRWLIAGMVMTAFLWWRGKRLPQGKEFVHLGVVGVALLGCANGLVVFAEQWIPSGLTALLLATIPLMMTGMESLVPRGPRLNLTTIVGLVLGLFGVCLIFWDDVRYLTNRENLIGIAAIMAGMTFWSSGSLYSKYVKVEVSPLMGASVEMLIAGIFLTALGVSIGEVSRWELDRGGLLSILYLIVFGSFVGYGSYIYALSKLPLSFVATATYINPIIALFLGWLILDETLNILVWVAAAAIIVGVFVVKQGSMRAPADN